LLKFILWNGKTCGRRYFHKADLKIFLLFLSTDISGGNLLIILIQQVVPLCIAAGVTEGIHK
jgi:hypothetical protein